MTPLEFTRNVRSLRRLRRIAQVLSRHGFGHIVAQMDLTRFLPVRMLRKKGTDQARLEGARAVGRRLAEVFAELGPTFVKLGQLMSTRPDLLPADVLSELRTLQDNVPPFDTLEAMAIISGELERPIEDCFEYIADTPLASASIGQVYRARAADGAALVVKVRRPGIEDVIKLDVQILRWLAESLERFMPELRMYRPAMLVEELDQTLTRELDYINEASATTRFAKAFQDDVGIRIPRVEWDLTSPKVLTLEALDGVNVETLISGPVEDRAGIDRKQVARRLTECFVKQVFELGSFHADPHPGNILVSPPATISLIDFGQVGSLSDELMTDLLVMVYAGINRELDVVVDTLADMGAVGRETDHRSLRRSLQVLLDKYYGLPVKRLDLGTLLMEFSDVMRRNDVVIPRDLSLLIKAVGTVGAVGAQLDADLNVLELLAPRIRAALRQRFSPAKVARETTRLGWDILSIVRRAPGQLRQALRRLSRGGFELQVRHENIDRLIRELDRSSNRLAFSIVIASIIVGSSMVFSAAADWKILGVEVRYFGVAGFVVAGLLGLGLSWAIFRSGRLH